MFHSWDNGITPSTFPYWYFVTSYNSPARVCPVSHEQEPWYLLHISMSPDLVLQQCYFKALLSINYSLIRPNTKKPWNLTFSSLLCLITYYMLTNRNVFFFFDKGTRKGWNADENSNSAASVLLKLFPYFFLCYNRKEMKSTNL
jgi:hypothetical protein